MYASPPPISPWSSIRTSASPIVDVDLGLQVGRRVAEDSRRAVREDDRQAARPDPRRGGQAQRARRAA